MFLRISEHRSHVSTSGCGRSIPSSPTRLAHEFWPAPQQSRYTDMFVAAAVAEKVQVRHAITGTREAPVSPLPLRTYYAGKPWNRVTACRRGAVLGRTNNCVARGRLWRLLEPPAIQESIVVFTGRNRTFGPTGLGLSLPQALIEQAVAPGTASGHRSGPMSSRVWTARRFEVSALAFPPPSRAAVLDMRASHRE